MKRAARVLVFALAQATALLDARALVAAEPALPEMETHEVKSGETLWTIAAAELGDGALWLAVYRANRDQIKNPRVLHPGQKLAIPALDPATREALRLEGIRGLSATSPR